MPIFANPFGLLALLGIPAVLAIHFLQRKSIQIPVSTLFLLDLTRRDAASGRRFERIIPSIPLWMQLLAVLILAWFLAEPRFQKSGSVQRIAIVIDSSASMGVFKEKAVARLIEELPTLQGPAETFEFTVLESLPDKPRVYAGSSMDELKAALGRWQPVGGLTDPSQALRLARSLVSREGSLIYLTDTPSDALPYDAKLVSVGDPVENVGITGITFSTEEGALVWKALLRNYGKEPAERTWTLQMANGGTQPAKVSISPGALVTLQSAFPKDAKNVKLVLSPDRFSLDDTLPMVAPSPKSISLFTATSPAFAGLTGKLLRSLESSVPTNDAATADLSISSYDPLDPVAAAGNSIVFVEDGTRTGSYLKGGILAEPHPLMDNLNWQSLLVRETIELERLPSDTVLLWQEKRALIFLRETPAVNGQPVTRQLCFNLDLRLSNAENQPAFIVLLHRFAETIRDAKVSSSSMMLETGQPIKVTSAPGAPVLVSLFDLDGKPLQSQTVAKYAPEKPGFLTVTQNDASLLNAAVFFADTREADFSACATSEASTGNRISSIEQHTKPDPLWRVWILLLLGALLLAWKFTKRGEIEPRLRTELQ